MKVVFTAAALRDLEEIAEWLAVHYPTIAPTIERRIRTVIEHIGRCPRARDVRTSAPECVLFLLAAILTEYFIASRSMRSKSSTSTMRHGGLGTSRNDR